MKLDVFTRCLAKPIKLALTYKTECETKLSIAPNKEQVSRYLEAELCLSSTRGTMLCFLREVVLTEYPSGKDLTLHGHATGKFIKDGTKFCMDRHDVFLKEALGLLQKTYQSSFATKTKADILHGYTAVLGVMAWVIWGWATYILVGWDHPDISKLTFPEVFTLHSQKKIVNEKGDLVRRWMEEAEENALIWKGISSSDVTIVGWDVIIAVSSILGKRSCEELLPAGMHAVDQLLQTKIRRKLDQEWEEEAREKFAILQSDTKRIVDELKDHFHLEKMLKQMAETLAEKVYIDYQNEWTRFQLEKELYESTTFDKWVGSSKVPIPWLLPQALPDEGTILRTSMNFFEFVGVSITLEPHDPKDADDYVRAMWCYRSVYNIILTSLTGRDIVLSSFFGDDRNMYNQEFLMMVAAWREHVFPQRVFRNKEKGTVVITRMADKELTPFQMSPYPTSWLTENGQIRVSEVHSNGKDYGGDSFVETILQRDFEKISIKYVDIVGDGVEYHERAHFCKFLVRERNDLFLTDVEKPPDEVRLALKETIAEMCQGDSKYGEITVGRVKRAAIRSASGKGSYSTFGDHGLNKDAIEFLLRKMASKGCKPNTSSPRARFKLGCLLEQAGYAKDDYAEYDV